MGAELISDGGVGDSDDRTYSTGRSATSGSTSAGGATSGKKDKRDNSKVKDVGRKMSQQGGSALQQQAQDDLGRTTRQDETPKLIDVPSFKRGGVKRKSGPARLHKGEHAVSARSKKRGKRKRERE